MKPNKILLKIINESNGVTEIELMKKLSGILLNFPKYSSILSLNYLIGTIENIDNKIYLTEKGKNIYQNYCLVVK